MRTRLLLVMFAIASAAATTTGYTARMTIGADEGPGFVKHWVFTPLSFELASMPVAFIDAVYRFELKSADGVTVKVTPTEKTFSLEGSAAKAGYQVEFYNDGVLKTTGTMAAVR